MIFLSCSSFADDIMCWNEAGDIIYKNKGEDIIFQDGIFIFNELPSKKIVMTNSTCKIIIPKQ